MIENRIAACPVDPEDPSRAASLQDPMPSDTFRDQSAASVTGEPGICGFPCTVRAQKTGKRSARVEIVSECKQIQRLAGSLTELSLKELFTPLTQNPVYIAAERAGCHASCAIPMAVLKAVEVAMGMAIARDVRIHFDREGDPMNQSD